MSISEIIKRRFKPNIKLNKFKEAKDVAKFIIEDPDAANKDQDFDGSGEQVQLTDIETDEMSSWPDLQQLLGDL